MVRVLLFATMPYSTNGYSQVGYELAKHLALHKKDIELTYYGFQNFNPNPAHVKERELPPNVQVYDAFAGEVTKSLGFGFDQVTDFVTMNKPDVVIIYNDMIVVSNILEKLHKVENKKFKIIVYIDQVYLYQKKEFIKRLNEQSDHVMAFTPYWEELVKGLGVTKPTSFLQHGFNPQLHYPVPMNLCRDYYNLKENDFIVLSLNRNQPRKRYDILLQAWAEFVSKHMEEPVKLLIATAIQGGWNLLEVYERELWKRGISLENGLKHVIFIDNPQQLTDEDVNILYNVSDISLSVVDGEGFGLCNFQQAAIGKPQIVPRIGGFLDFFDDDTAIMLEPKMTFYIDSGRDGVGGEAQLVDYKDAAAALERYYKDPILRENHGKNARKKILSEYGWPKIGNKLYDIIMEVHNYSTVTNIINASQTSQTQPQIQSSTNMSATNINIKSLLDDNTTAVPKQDNINNSSANSIPVSTHGSKTIDNNKISLSDIDNLDIDSPEPTFKSTPKIDNIPKAIPISAPTPSPTSAKIPIPVVVEDTSSDDDQDKDAEKDTKNIIKNNAILTGSIKAKKKKNKKKGTVTTTNSKETPSVKERLQQKLEEKQKDNESKKIEKSNDELDIKSLLELKEKIDRLLASK